MDPFWRLFLKSALWVFIDEQYWYTLQYTPLYAFTSNIDLRHIELGPGLNIFELAALNIDIQAQKSKCKFKFSNKISILFQVYLFQTVTVRPSFHILKVRFVLFISNNIGLH